MQNINQTNNSTIEVSIWSQKIKINALSNSNKKWNPISDVENNSSKSHNQREIGIEVVDLEYMENYLIKDLADKAAGKSGVEVERNSDQSQRGRSDGLNRRRVLRS